ncbi:hypothetical protein [Paracoccus aerius]|uniref:PH domain-containing protein n=1 Tax=Paracoccus aerius TaxID=1915382 RepID=A0ABS1SCX4_9RHOB|nr:hypothetical protein [Paracoccus aerius]MBL3675532.1 hypothetical protein [Paracoccus aerius]GHG34918.1 hypothetical protein GCM10017322_37190 [Paracoccus aerius]
MPETPIVQFGTNRFLQARDDFFFAEAETPAALTVVQSSSDPSRVGWLAALARARGQFYSDPGSHGRQDRR